MTRFMYDSTSPADLPLSAEMVGYYVDGIYAVSEATVRARFPHAVLVGISAIGTNAGIVGDVEPGCMSVQGGVIWVLMRRKAGFDPTLYVNEMNTWGPARQAFHSQGIPEPHWWVADYDGIGVVPAGAVAKQFENPTLVGYGHFDLSVVLDFWPGVDGVFGPGGGSLGGDHMDPTNPTDQKVITQIQALYNQMTSPTYKTLDDRIAAVLAAIKAQSAGGGLTEQQITDAVTAAFKNLTLKGA